MTTMRRPFAWVLFALVLVAALGWALPRGEAEEESGEVRDGVFLHISHGQDHPQRVLMGLAMARIMSDDHPVVVYCDVKGVRLLLQPEHENSEVAARKGAPNSGDVIAQLISSGVEVYACPGCLEVAGGTASDLREGVQVATQEAFFDFTKGRILSLDY